MSIEATTQRQAIDMIVRNNPVSVTVTRVIDGLNPDTGGRSQSTETKGPFEVALFSGVPKALMISEDHIRADRVEWSALTRSDSDFASGGNVTDTFEVSNYGKFKVTNVVEIETHQEITGKLLYLELLK